MGIRTILYLIFIIGFNSSHCQNYGNKTFYLVDSLNLENVSPDEKKSLDSILTLYHENHLTDDTSKFFYLEQLVTGYESADIEGLYRIEYLKQTQSINFSKKRLPLINKRLNYAKGYALANVGIMHLYQSHQDSALFYMQAAIPFINKTDSNGVRAVIYNAAAYCAKNLGLLNLAIEHSIQALDIAEKSSDSAAISSVYNNLGGLHQSLENFEKANYYYLKTVEFAKGHSKSNYGISLCNYGEFLLETGDTIKAMDYLLKSEEIIDTSFNTYLDKKHGSYVYSQLGKVYLHMVEISKSEYYLNKGLALVLETNSTDIGWYYADLARLQFVKGDLEKSLSHALDALEIAESKAMLEMEADAHKLLYEIYLKLNLSEKALHHLEKHWNTLSVFRDQENKKEILQKTYQYEYHQKFLVDSLKTNELLILAKAREELADEKARKKQTQLYLAIGIVILTTVFLYIIFTRLKIIREQKVKLDKAYHQLELSKENELAASNLKAIKSQMNPHFIFNCINSIQSLVLQKETLKSYDYLVEFSQLVRTILDFSEREFIPLSEEISFLETYLDLEQLRFEDNFSYKITTDIDNKSLRIPSLIVQPFAENAIKHGLLYKDGNKFLSIHFSTIKNGVRCTIEDNGIGITADKKIKERQNESHKSFSTRAITERLKLLKHQTNSDAGYEIKPILKNSEEVGTMVTITMPVK